MTEELDILKIVAENPNISQRKISEQTGISLGQVNFLIKKCVKKGLIKIEGQTTRSIKYNLTPKGIAEKTELMLSYIKISYGAILLITEKIKNLIDQYVTEGKDLYICGDKDEIMGILKLLLDNITLLTKPVDNAVIFYWDEDLKNDKEKNIDTGNSKWINIIE